ncbi:MAG: rod-binding protein [Brevundimonas sp.]|uniref:rod-binding protein n=1 Tax=Brevundimonas sp. TaxID=1871086 RepID=UPI00391D430C
MAPSVDLLRGAPGLTTLSGADTARIRQTAQDFEATFLAQMLRPMFEGLSTEAPFGGGHAEETWRGFLIDEMGKQISRSGGIGLADQVMAEMIRMQSGRSTGPSEGDAA